LFGFCAVSNTLFCMYVCIYVCMHMCVCVSQLLPKTVWRHRVRSRIKARELSRELDLKLATSCFVAWATWARDIRKKRKEVAAFHAKLQIATQRANYEDPRLNEPISLPASKDSSFWCALSPTVLWPPRQRQVAFCAPCSPI
jgi:hypothetical protein